MSNIPRGSKLLWVHCIMTWIVSLLVYSVRAHPLRDPAAEPALTPKTMSARTLLRARALLPDLKPTCLWSTTLFLSVYGNYGAC